MIPYSKLLKSAKRNEKSMVRLLRELVAIPGQSGTEGPVIGRIEKEMRRGGRFDRVWRDKFGNLFGQIGTGRRLIAIDAHVDTVGVGDRAEWKHDPYKGKVAGGVVYGRGAGDQRGAVPAMLCAAGLIREHGLLDGVDCALLMAFTVSEEDCDGLNWQYILRETKLRPECVVVTDSTNCQILRGQRGRMEIGVTVRGKSCHGSMPHKGINAIYRMNRVIREIEALGPKLKDDKFLGKATITVSYIDCSTPSMCAVPDRAYIHIDRRLTTGDTKESALREVRAAVRRAGVLAEVAIPVYKNPTHTGMVYPSESYFPTWLAKEDDPQVAAAVEVYRRLFRKKPKVGRWTFSTNGVSIAGMFGVPCVGFGPAPESVAHTVNDSVPIKHLVDCAAFYAAYPAVYCATNPRPPRHRS